MHTSQLAPINVTVQVALQSSPETLTSHTTSSFPGENILIFPAESTAGPSKDHIPHKISVLLFRNSSIHQGRGWVEINLDIVVSLENFTFFSFFL